MQVIARGDRKGIFDCIFKINPTDTFIVLFYSLLY